MKAIGELHMKLLDHLFGELKAVMA